jgi:hypothetical protein
MSDLCAADGERPVRIHSSLCAPRLISVDSCTLQASWLPSSSQ